MNNKFRVDDYFYITFKDDKYKQPELTVCYDIEHYIRGGYSLLADKIKEYKELQDEHSVYHKMSEEELKKDDMEYQQGYVLGHLEAIENLFYDLNIMVDGITDVYLEDNTIYKIPKQFLVDVYSYIEKNMDYSNWLDFDGDEPQEPDTGVGFETVEELTQYEVDYYEEQCREGYIDLFASNFASDVGKEAWTYASSKNKDANLLPYYEEWGLDYSGEYGTHTRSLVDLMEEMNLFKK